MGIAQQPSKITLPDLPKPYPSLLEFLARRFPRIPAPVWERRLEQGKLLDEQGRPITRTTPYLPYRTIFYFREVEAEREIPFQEEILFQDQHLLVCCKPHFLPVTPTGRFVEQSLLSRLRKKTGNADLVPLHRLDRETAGLLLFSTNRESTGLYSRLFFDGKVEKTYLALACCGDGGGERNWEVENRIVAGEPWFRMQVVPGEPNASSRISLVERRQGVALFSLRPFTGKTHQLRLHMAGLGFPIMNDRLYPELMPRQEDDFSRPLKLLAWRLRFEDPLSGKLREFESPRSLTFPPPISEFHPA